MQPARIAALLEPFLRTVNDQQPTTNGRRLTAADLSRISTYIDILTRWNARVNLTSIRDPEEIVTRHFGESFFLGRLLVLTEARLTLADLGSGAGFPGLPIKLRAPRIALTLIESNHKRAAFLREVTRALALSDVRVANTRAETLPPASFDVVTLRAVERISDSLQVASRLLTPRGRLALLVGSSQLEAIHAALPSVDWQAPMAVPQSKSRVVLIGSQNHPR